MADRPIIFSAPMIRALLDGRKYQTRRKLPDHKVLDGLHLDQVGPTGWQWTGAGGQPRLALDPGYAPGDRLWVREAWRVGAWNQCDGGIAVDYLADNYARKEWLYSPSWTDQVHRRLIEQSRADAEKAGAHTTAGGWEYTWLPGDGPCRARPSIHMPRWVSRLTLTVTDVRVQRLQEISEADAKAEGCRGFVSANGEDGVSPREEFQDLWNILHGPDAWDQNPWVCAISFDVHRCNIDQMEAP